MEANDLSKLGQKLQLRAAELMIKVKDECFSTKKVFTLITSRVDELTQILLDIIKNKFRSLGPTTHILSIEEVGEILSDLDGFSMFEGLHTSKELVTFVAGKSGFVEPVPVDIVQKQVLQGPLLKTVSLEKGYFVPFLAMLERLLNCPEVLHCISNPKAAKEGHFTSPLDGYVCQQHPIVKKFGLQNTLIFGTYDDDAQCTDTASSQSVSVRFIYWCLLNLHRELRTGNRAIHLLSCVKTDLIKATGHKAFMDDFICGVNALSSEEGVDFRVLGEIRNFHGALLEHSADNPAAASCCGCKESPLANHPCRQCDVASQDLYSSFDEMDFQRRNLDSHKAQLAELDSYQKMTTQEQKKVSNPSVKYGINHKSALMDVAHFDVTKCFPQDLMHDVILGTLKNEIVCLLKHVLQKKGTTLKAINETVARLAKNFGVNKPAPIEVQHLEKKKLRQSASETLTLAHILPFALKKRPGGKDICDEANLNCFILRLNLLDFQMSPEFSMEDVSKLKRMTIEHHKRFKELYPDYSIPKMHYEIHFPAQILLFGPLRFHWCFRFEGKHAYFKRICRLIHNYVNIYLSLASRHQEKQCGLMMLCSINPETAPYLKPNNKQGVPRKIQLAKCIHRDLVIRAFKLDPTSCQFVEELKYVVEKGVHLNKSSAIVATFVREVPICGEVVAIYKHCKEIAVVYLKLKTETFDVSLNAFKVLYRQKLGVILISDMVYHHHIPFIRELGGNYILLPSKSYLASKF